MNLQYMLSLSSVAYWCTTCIALRFVASSQSFVEMVQRKETGAELVGSWTVEIGDQDEAGLYGVHGIGFPLTS